MWRARLVKNGSRKLYQALNSEKAARLIAILRSHEVKPEVRRRLQELEAPGAKKLHEHDFSPYKNHSEPKLPAGGDYIEIYVTDLIGDSRRIVIDRKTRTTYYTPDHYQTWNLIDNPWMHGGPAGL